MQGATVIHTKRYEGRRNMPDQNQENDQKNAQNKDQSKPMLIRLEKDGLVVYPRMEQQPDGSWKIARPDLFKGFLKKETSSEE
jgi:hypothetical protein